MIGLQRKITLFIYEICKISRSKITNALSIEHIADMCQTTKFSVRKTIQRLENKKIVTRNTFKNGRGGWTRYELSDVIFKEIMQEETQDKLRTNLGQSEDKVRPQLRTELRTTSSSSSSERNTTTELSEEWQTIDLSSLESIGLTFGHLTQLQRSGIESSEIIQDSINHFSYDLIHNSKAKEIKTTAIGYFMGIMKRAGLYTAPDNYESEKDRTLRIYMETKKRQQEKQMAVEAELIDLSYNEWSFGLTEDEKKSLLPEHTLNSKLEGPKIAALKTYFKKNIWPEKSKVMFQKQVKEV